MYLLKITSLIFALGLFIADLFSAPVYSELNELNTNKDIRTYNIKPFSKIYLEGAYKVILEQGLVSGLRIETKESNFDYIDVVSNPESLSLKVTKKRFNFDELILYITFKELDKIVLEGGILLETKGYVEFKNISLHIAGGANINMNLKANNLFLVGEGGVKIELDGVCNELTARISGAGHLDAIGLKTKKTDFKIEGVGGGSVYATEFLYATIRGVGKIRYKGEPQVFKKIEGVGVVSND